MRNLAMLLSTALLAGLVAATPVAQSAPSQANASPKAKATATPEEVVAFNTKTHKFHCRSCQWAKKCTVNCVDVPIHEALKSGVACRVCGGTCQ